MKLETFLKMSKAERIFAAGIVTESTLERWLSEALEPWKVSAIEAAWRERNRKRFVFGRVPSDAVLAARATMTGMR